MKNTGLLFSHFKPLLSGYTKKLIASQTTDIPTFLFHGRPHSGKEWSAIKLIQALNCKDFFLENHQILYCLTCSRINMLKAEYGIYALFIDFKTEIIERFLSLIERKIPLDILSKESFSHELAKLSTLLEAQFIKEQKSSPSKKLGFQKLQEYTESLTHLQHQIVSDEVLSSYEFIYPLLKDIEVLSGDISVEYLKHLLHKLQMSSSQLHYRALIIKDPIKLRNQELFMNMLLKTVEDSKKNLSIFFISEKKPKILKTIQSRSTAIHFGSITESYLQILKEEFPLYPLQSFKETPKKTLTLEELLVPSNLTEENILSYLEEKKSTLISSSPLFKAKQQEITRLILGIKEYRISIKNVQDILPFL